MLERRLVSANGGSCERKGHRDLWRITETKRESELGREMKKKILSPTNARAWRMEDGGRSGWMLERDG
jgi:hypothetical protein